MAEPFKNVFNPNFVYQLSAFIYKHEKEFLKEFFEQKVLNDLELLELKERMRLISTSIKESLPLSYSQTIEVLKKVKEEFSKEELGVLSSMVFPDFIEVYGLEDVKLSLEALEFFTIDSSSEFAIRHFIVNYEEEAMNKMLEWAKSDNEHIRRLASEGCRPRLPWGIALTSFKKDPSKVLEILEILKNDKSEYVRKSVANNLNDISKDNPKIVIYFIKKNINQNKNLNWILKHGARTLLKQSNKEILKLFGFEPKKILLKDFKSQKKVVMGKDLVFEFTIHSKEPLGQLRIEYSIDLVRKNGNYSNKVFHISSGKYQTLNRTITKRHSFKKITTRKYYEGKHIIYIIVNGETLAQKEFTLIQ